MSNHQRQRYRAADAFHIFVICFVTVAVLILTTLGYGILLPRYEASLTETRSRLTTVLAESVADDIRRGSIVLAQTRLSRLSGVGGISGTELTGINETTPSRGLNQIVYDHLIFSGSQDSTPLARLFVFYSADEERLAKKGLLLLLSATILTALGMFLCLAYIGQRLLIEPLRQVAHNVRMSDDSQEITIPRVSPIEVLDVIEAHNQRLATIKTLNDEKAQLNQRAAVSRMTQMLAHDVRKPFSILRMGLNLLQDAPTPDAVKSIIHRLIPEVEKATGQVNGLIADVMEIGSPPVSSGMEPLDPTALIEAALLDVVQVFPTADIEFSYDLTHKHRVSAHPRKVVRIFSNILTNAIEALGHSVVGTGQIWFRTRDIDGFVEFCIGNSGSIIPADDLKKLFDAFFTSGKKSGTGLGLAIAQKVVTDHGGRIWCKSHTSSEHTGGMVEFYFTLPITTEVVSLGSPTNLPKHTRDIAGRLIAPSQELPVSEPAIFCKIADPLVIEDPRSSTGDWTTKTDPSQKLPAVLVVEDNPFILDAWMETLSKDSIAHGVASPENLLQMLAEDPDFVHRLTCVVTDLHFDNSTRNGLDVGRMIKRHRSNLPVFLSSDGWVSAEELAESIDKVIPKEALTFSRLLGFL